MFGVYLTYCCHLCPVSVGEMILVKKKAEGLVLAPSTHVLACSSTSCRQPFFDGSCSCLSFLTCRWSHGKGNPVMGSSVAILLKLENFMGGMYKIHHKVCPFLLTVILNSLSLELSSYFPFLATAVKTKIYILSMKTEVSVEKLQLELWELCSWDSVRSVCVCMHTHPSQELFGSLEPTMPGKDLSFLLILALLFVKTGI